MRSSVLCLGLVVAMVMGCRGTQPQNVRVWLRDEPGRTCVVACETAADDYASTRLAIDDPTCYATIFFPEPVIAACNGGVGGRALPQPDAVVCVEKDVRSVREAATAGAVVGVVVCRCGRGVRSLVDREGVLEDALTFMS